MNFVCSERNGKVTPFGKHGRLHVDGRHLVDENGEVVALHGISTHNLNYYPEYVNEEAFTQFADEYGVDIMRLAMYTQTADDVPGYADTDDEGRRKLEELMLTGVRICASLGIYCIVDWHILFDYNPKMNEDMSAKFWNSMALRLRDYDNVIFEICNEPNMNTETGDKATWDDIRGYAHHIIDVIRDIDETKVIIVGTPIWSQRVDDAADNPLEYDNIMYTLHFYADSHKDELRGRMKYAIDKDLPIFVTEFGICDASGNGPVNDAETDIWLKELEANDISYVIWNLSNKDETSAILKPECDKINNFTSDDLSPCGERMVRIMTKFK